MPMSDVSLLHVFKDVYFMISGMLSWRLLNIILDNTGIRLNLHISSLIGVSSVLWSSHVMLIAIPISRGSIVQSIAMLMDNGIRAEWNMLGQYDDTFAHISGTSLSSGNAILSFTGGLNINTSSLHLSDIAHHHLALGIISIWTGHLYTSVHKAIGHRTSKILTITGYRFGSILMLSSYSLQLALSMSSISIATGLIAHQMYSYLSYPYITYDLALTVTC